MKLFFIFFLLIITLSSLANNQINPKIPTSAFIENVGQLEEMTTLKPVNDVLFYVSTPDAFMYLRKNGISYVFHKSIFSVKEEYDMGIPKIEKVEWQRVDVDFVNSSTERVIKEEQVDWKYNFYYAHCPSGITGVRAYKSVTYKNIYPGIDWHIYYNSEGELKYDFIVNPGANPSLIRLQYNYSNKPKLDIDGSVLVENDLGSIIENKPFAYQEIENIPIKWIVNDNILSFDIDSYNKKSPLIIDPFLIWSTYMGSSGTDYSEGVATDDNMLVVSGYTTSSSFPTVNPGGTAFFQGSLVSSSDAYIAKFSTNGIPDWITYYGGSGNDNNNGRVLLTPNYIFVAGQTGSNDFPTFDPGNGAYYDGVFPTNGDV